MRSKDKRTVRVHVLHALYTVHVLHSFFIHVYDPLCPTNVAN